MRRFKNRLTYTIAWLKAGKPVQYGNSFTVPASLRHRRKVLKDARRIYGLTRFKQ